MIIIYLFILQPPVTPTICKAPLLNIKIISLAVWILQQPMPFSGSYSPCIIFREARLNRHKSTTATDDDSSPDHVFVIWKLRILRLTHNKFCYAEASDADMRKMSPARRRLITPHTKWWIFWCRARIGRFYDDPRSSFTRTRHSFVLSFLCRPSDSTPACTAKRIFSARRPSVNVLYTDGRTEWIARLRADRHNLTFSLGREEPQTR